MPNGKEGLMRDVVIIGAGISGLSLGYFLRQAGLDAVVIDPKPLAGGAIESSLCNGFLLEMGPNASLSKPSLLRLIEQVGLSEEVLFPSESAKNRFLALSREGQIELVPTPHTPTEAISTSILTTRAKLRIFAEPFISHGLEDDLDVASFMKRRIGPEVTETVIAAALSGIWASDINTLSCRSALPLLWSFVTEDKSIIRGCMKSLKKKKQHKEKKTPRKLISFSKGMNTLPLALAASLSKDAMFLDVTAENMELKRSSVEISCSRPEENGARLTRASIRAHTAVLTCPAGEAARLLMPINPGLASRIRAIPYAPLGVIHLAFEKEKVSHPLDGFGFLVPPNLGYATLGAIANSSLFPGRAPEGFHLLTCFAGGAAKPELANVRQAEIQERVIREVCPLINASKAPEVLSSRYYQEAIPNFPLYHYRTQELAKTFSEECPTLRFLGNWLQGISVSDRIQEAEMLAKEILEELSLTDNVESYQSSVA